MITALILYICTSPMTCQAYVQQTWSEPAQTALCDQTATRLTRQLTPKNHLTVRFECVTQPT